ncbi:hypothetical protein BIS06_22410, partial [Halomonas sp. BBD48]|nr:hypothetical protein [Halomonas sp. BBD48]
MPESALLRRCNEAQAMRRLHRLGANSLEPAWLRLWAYAVTTSQEAPAAWLLCHADMHRALLLGEALPAGNAPPHDELVLAKRPPPDRGTVSRLWFWERMMTLRRWQASLALESPQTVQLPIWLGYARQRKRHRVLVISGLSGETLTALK